jgi:hypothetical protein
VFSIIFQDIEEALKREFGFIEPRYGGKDKEEYDDEFTITIPAGRGPDDPVSRLKLSE